MDRLPLARLPTPLDYQERLSAAWGAQIWVKRDDLTGFGLSGNKVRKLEYHLRAAIDAGATTLITCGAAQSNHCRATALAAAPLGLNVVLFLRTPDGCPPQETSGNHLLQRLAGASCRFVTPEQWDDRDVLMAEEATAIGDAWVIPEGASDAIGARGFVAAIHELAPQVRDLQRPLTIWHAASSAGTTAGLIRGAEEANLDAVIVGCSVGDPARDIADHVGAILGTVPPSVAWRITDDHVGVGYGLATDEELAVQAEATRLTGLILDPTYTGKALYGLRSEIRNGAFGPEESIVFWHTGGGFAAFAFDWPLPAQ